MLARSEAVDVTDGAIGVIIGAVTGAGGMAGLWAYLRAKLTDDGETLRQYYDHVNSELTRQKVLLEKLESEHAAERREWQREREELKGHLHSIEMEHAAERAEWHVERAEWHAERDALRDRIDELETRTSEVHLT